MDRTSFQGQTAIAVFFGSILLGFVSRREWMNRTNNQWRTCGGQGKGYALIGQPGKNSAGRNYSTIGKAEGTRPGETGPSKTQPRRFQQHYGGGDPPGVFNFTAAGKKAHAKGLGRPKMTAGCIFRISNGKANSGPPFGQGKMDGSYVVEKKLGQWSLTLLLSPVRFTLPVTPSKNVTHGAELGMARKTGGRNLANYRGRHAVGLKLDRATLLATNNFDLKSRAQGQIRSKRLETAQKPNQKHGIRNQRS